MAAGRAVLAWVALALLLAAAGAISGNSDGRLDPHGGRANETDSLAGIADGSDLQPHRTAKASHRGSKAAFGWRSVLAYGPSKREGHSLTAVGTRLFVFGGCFLDLACYNDVYVFDTRKSTWYEPLPSGDIPPARGQHTASLVDKKLWLIGGSANQVYRSDVYSLDTEKFEWRLENVGGAALLGREGHTAVVHGDSIVIFGGYTRHGYQDDVFVLDTKQLVWSRPRVHGEAPSPRSDHSAVLVGSIMFVFGGTSDQGDAGDLHLFDVNVHQWERPSTKGRAPPACHGAAMVARDNLVLVTGGCSYDARTCYNSTYVLNTESAMWSQVPVVAPAQEPDAAALAAQRQQQAAVAQQATASKNATNATAGNRTDFHGHTVTLPSGEGLHQHPWKNEKGFKRMQRQYLKAKGLKGRQLGEGGKQSAAAAPFDEKEQATGKDKSKQPSGGGGDAVAVKKKRVVKCRGFEDLARANEVVHDKAFPVPLRPLGCAAKSHGEEPAAFTPRDEAAGALVNNVTLFLFGGCFLNHNCTFDLVRMDVPRGYQPPVEDWPWGNLPAPRSPHDPNTPEPGLDALPPHEHQDRDALRRLQVQKQAAAKAKKAQKGKQKKTSFLEEHTRFVDDFDIEDNEPVVPPMAFRAVQEAPVASGPAGRGAVAPNATKNGTAVPKPTSTPTPKPSSHANRRSARVVRLTSELPTVVEEKQRGALSTNERLIYHALEEDLREPRHAGVKPLKVAPGRIHFGNGDAASTAAAAGQRPTAPLRATPHADAMHERVWARQHPVQAAEKARRSAAEARARALARRKALRAARGQGTEEEAKGVAVAAAAPEAPAAVVSPLRAETDSLLSQLFVPLVIVLALVVACGAYVLCMDRAPAKAATAPASAAAEAASS